MDIKRGLQIPVYDLGCGGSGPSNVERVLAATNGVVRAYVNRLSETAHVDYDPAEVGPADMVRVIARAGYQPGRPIEG